MIILCKRSKIVYATKSDYLLYMIKNDHIIIEAKMYVSKISVILRSLREWQFFLLGIANCVV